jgi:hypothetical protein
MEENYKRGAIINYLTLEFMKKADPHSNPSARVRSSYIKALKKYYKMRQIEKENIINIIEKK